MSTQKTKKRTIKYEVEYETDTDFREELFRKMFELSVSTIGGYFKGKVNKIRIKSIEVVK